MKASEVSEMSGASEAGQMSGGAKRARGPVQSDSIVNLLNLSWSTKQNLVCHLTRSSYVGHMIEPQIYQ